MFSGKVTIPLTKSNGTPLQALTASLRLVSASAVPVPEVKACFLSPAIFLAPSPTVPDIALKGLVKTLPASVTLGTPSVQSTTPSLCVS